MSLLRLFFWLCAKEQLYSRFDSTDMLQENGVVGEITSETTFTQSFFAEDNSTAKAVYEEQLTVPQGKTSRTVYLPKSLCEELRIFYWERHILSGPIFITRSGNPVDPANIRKSLNKICAMEKG